MHFRVYAYQNSSRAVNYLIIIKQDCYIKICLIISILCAGFKLKKEEVQFSVQHIANSFVRAIVEILDLKMLK